MIFLDTGFLFALFVEGDDHHDRVRQVFEGFRGRRLQELLLTTNRFFLRRGDERKVIPTEDRPSLCKMLEQAR